MTSVILAGGQQVPPVGREHYRRRAGNVPDEAARGDPVHRARAVSFSDRTAGGLVAAPANGQRWVWYAEAGRARLWSGADALSARREAAGGFALDVNAVVAAKTVSATTTNTTNLSAAGVTVNQLAANTVNSPNYTGTKVAVTGPVTAGSVTAGIANGDIVRGPTADFDRVTTEQLQAGVISGGTLESVRARIITGVTEDRP